MGRLIASLARRLGPLLWIVGAVSACALLPQLFESKQVREWKTRTVELRELEFTDRVRFRLVDREEISAIVRSELDRSLSPEQARRYADAYAAMGLLPPGIDLLGTLQTLYEQELAGMYSPRLRTMFVLEGLDSHLAGNVDSTVIHELVHALQHQHFPRVLEVLQSLRHNDDTVTALGSIIEGDASLTMLAVPGSSLHRDLYSAEIMRDAMLAGLAQTPDVGVPRVIMVSLMFPYAYGTVLSARGYADGGNDGLDRLLVEGPLSTHALMFPDEPALVEYVKLPEARLAETFEARGCRLGDSNVAGALSMQVLFEEHGSADDLEPLLRAWRGDRFLHVDCEGVWELVWLTRWATEAMAQRFARRYDGIATRVAEGRPVSGPLRTRVFGRGVLVFTPGVEALAETIAGDSEVRDFLSLREWLAADCFPESPCPGF